MLVPHFKFPVWSSKKTFFNVTYEYSHYLFTCLLINLFIYLFSFVLFCQIPSADGKFWVLGYLQQPNGMLILWWKDGIYFSLIKCKIKLTAVSSCKWWVARADVVSVVNISDDTCSTILTWVVPVTDMHWNTRSCIYSRYHNRTIVDIRNVHRYL